MKCIVLAGGRGERLWPLSRKNYPKQFIQIQRNHSVFQETVARNIPYCDEFIIVTSQEYRFIIENQMKAFQGTPYRCVFEEIPRKTTAAILLSCLGLQPSELVFVVAADHIIDSQMNSVGDELGYKDSILCAKELAKQGSLVLFGKKEKDIDGRYGYITGLRGDGGFDSFIEKPDKSFLNRKHKNIYRNLGMLLFENGAFQNEMGRKCPDILRECKEAYEERISEKHTVTYTADIQKKITPISIERGLISITQSCKAVKCGFRWRDIGSLEDIATTDYPTEGISITNDCNNTTVINNAKRQAVVVNDLDNVLVVNTPDAVYISRYGKSGKMKELLSDYEELRPYGEKGTIFYRSWGFYENLVEEVDYRIRQVYLNPGKTIYLHKHTHRSENWTVIKGKALITLDGVSKVYGARDNIDIPINMEHQISNVDSETVVFVETAVGEILHGGDIVSKTSADLTESELGYTLEPMIKLSPAFKDYLWGGTKLRDVYGMDCDYNIIAESWMLSAHPDGPSIVASGKHRGLNFSDYLDVVGIEALGWKCSPLQTFPLLIKFIDAKGNLSVQVHPSDDYVLENENQYGKNKMWYVVDAEPGSGLYVGFNKDVSREEVERRVKDNSILEILNFLPTHPGDVFFIPAGTVHAIGEGNLICEIQQSSNCTYRLYDYDRRDKYGNTRELHLSKALDVLNYKKYQPFKATTESDSDGVVLSRCKYFESTVYEIRDRTEIQIDDTKFQSLVCIDGAGEVTLRDMTLSVKAGESIFIPAVAGQLIVTGKLSVVLSHI